jgi:hypothetical protein
MKRFYCTICKRARRTRKFPSNIVNPDAIQVTDRTGTCNWHNLVVTGSYKASNSRQEDARFNRVAVVKGGR